MDVRVIELPPVTLAYLRHTGPFGPALGAFWRDVFNPWRAAHGLMNRTTYGIAQDDPSTTPPEQCRYDACLEVADDYVAPAPAAVTRFPGGRFAAVRYRGTASSGLPSPARPTPRLLCNSARPGASRSAASKCPIA